MDTLTVLSVAQTWVTEHAVQPLLILFIGIFVAKLSEQVLLFLFRQLKLTHERYRVIAWFVLVGLSVASVCWALASIDLLKPIVWVLAGVVSVVVVLWFILMFRDAIPNAAKFSQVRKLLKNGTAIKNKLAEGKIVAVQLTDTHIQTISGDNLFIPNSTMAKLLVQKK